MSPQALPRSGPHTPELNLIERAREVLPRLRPSERKVAELMLADPNAFSGLTLAGAARASGVSEPTVLRFCEALGCDGFAEFRLRLARSAAFGVPATHSVISPADPPARITEKIFDYTLTSLDRARRHLDPAAVAAAIELLAAARRIEFCGFGASGIVAQDAQQKFPLFGCPCGASTDHHQQYMVAMTMGPGDVLVAISHTGETLAVRRAAAAARRRGAKAIGITGRGDAPLATACDIVLVVETLENTDVFTPTISRLAALVVVDILSTGVALRRGHDNAMTLREMKRGLAAMRAGDGDSGPEPAAWTA
jgi:RpiR family carbohydrate utilization transcriptional regulator